MPSSAIFQISAVNKGEEHKQKSKSNYFQGPFPRPLNNSRYMRDCKVRLALQPGDRRASLNATLIYLEHSGSLRLRFPPTMQLSVLRYFSRLVLGPADLQHQTATRQELYWGADLNTRRRPKQRV